MAAEEALNSGTPAAQYVRMSTEHQQYSTENQSVAILQYALAHGMTIVRTYADHGKSGLVLSGRQGLTQLLEDVRQDNAPFTSVLVYDVSRWGRFQDADESAYYEHVLKKAGIKIHYCAEPFENDGSLPSALIKTLKRTMAGEYSRELSVKVFAGQCRLIELGYRQGGTAGYGLRRHLVDEARTFKQVLGHGEYKSIQTDRVVLAPGPQEELEVVRAIFRRFTDERKTEAEIALMLNDEGVRTEYGREWNRATVRQVLTNPKYIGSNVYNRRSFKLKQKHIKNPPEAWIYKANAFDAIVPREQYGRALDLIAERSRSYTDEELLDRLRKLLERTGRLSGMLIDEAGDMPCSSAYAARFGSLPRAYTMIGWDSGRDYRYLEVNRQVRERYSGIIQQICARLEGVGSHVSQDAKTDILTINREYSVSLVIARCRESSAGNHRWLVRFDAALQPDITIVVRLLPGNSAILDYYLLPDIADLGSSIRLASDNPLFLDAFRFDDLEFFTSLARRTRMEEAA
jgi:DNA invertase Pin-like site-specific DNA recombinase